MNVENLDIFYQIAKEVRSLFEKEYGTGTDLCGHCIEASELIAKAIQEKTGIDAVTVEGWCRFDDEYYGSDHPWDPHTWVEVPSLGLYIDVTADQFNYGMYEENEYGPVEIRKGLPHGMCYEEPTFEEELESNSFCLGDLIKGAAERCKGSEKSGIEKGFERE